MRPRVCEPRDSPQFLRAIPQNSSQMCPEGYTPDNPETPEQVQNFLSLNLAIPFHGAKIPFVITHMRAGHGMTRKESRSATVPNRVWYTADYTPVNQETLRTCGSFEGAQEMEFLYAGSKLQTQRIEFDMAEYVVHWTKAASFPILLATGIVDNGWKIQETGFNSSEVKDEIFFHRVADNHSQLTNSPQYDAIKVKSDVIIRQPYGKEVGIVIRLSTLVETLPNKVFLSSSGVLVAPTARTSTTTTSA